MSKHPMNNGTGVIRVIRAARYSLLGLIAAWQNESAFRQELTLAVLFIPLGIWLGQNGLERAFLVGTVLLVLIVELLNSAVEAVVDRIGPEIHELAGRAKDMGSAAVFLSLLLAGFAYIMIACDRFIT